MKKLLLLALLIAGCKAIESRWDKTVLSVGIGDSRTGMSFIGFSYNILQKDKDEVFLGIGTAFFIYTASLIFHIFKRN